MYIEFYLPDDIATTGSSNVIQFIRKNIVESVDDWAKRYDVAYRRKTVKNVLRITFDHDSYYTLFATSWQPPQVGKMHQWWFTYRIVEPMSTWQ
jgi:hypothetical protein